VAGVQIDGVNNKIDFDDDQDTSISANTDDTLVFEIAGATDFTMTANTFTAESGSTIAAQALTATGIDVTGAITATAASTITLAGTGDNLTLASTDAGASAAPNLRLYRNSSSPANDDLTATVDFEWRNDNSQDVIGFQIDNFCRAVSDGAEENIIRFKNMFNGTLTEFMRADSQSDQAVVTFNEISNDIDFRVESNSNTHMLFVDAGNDRISLGSESPSNTGAMVTVAQGDSGATVNSTFDAFCIEGGGSRGMNILTPNNQIGGIAFGDPEDNDIGAIHYDHASNSMKFIVNASERLRINEGGAIKLASGGDPLQGTLTNDIHSVSSATNLTVWEISSGNASYSNSCLSVGAVRTANAAYALIGASTGDGSSDRFNDLEFKVRGDGNVLSDGGTTLSSPADYAEMFEWNDGNSSDEDRVGISVKLSGNKIVASSSSDDAAHIIGVVSGNPAVLGDAAWNKHHAKYEMDEYNRTVYETYTITTWTEVVDDGDDIKHEYHTDKIPSGTTAPTEATAENKLTVISKEDDNTTDLTRKKLNSSWDSTLTYVARQDRKEWDAVGMMGKLRMKKGQKTGTNWIKMRDISDTVEEWLVR
jgi:hypothetical protein